jgi:DNA-binding NarL/FixJ family response regulator
VPAVALVSGLPQDVSGDGVVLGLVVDGARCVVTRSIRTERDSLAQAARFPPVYALTPREQEIARIVATGSRTSTSPACWR